MPSYSYNNVIYMWHMWLLSMTYLLSWEIISVEVLEIIYVEVCYTYKSQFLIPMCWITQAFLGLPSTAVPRHKYVIWLVTSVERRANWNVTFDDSLYVKEGRSTESKSDCCAASSVIYPANGDEQLHANHHLLGESLTNIQRNDKQDGKRESLHKGD